MSILLGGAVRLLVAAILAVAIVTTAMSPVVPWWLTTVALLVVLAAAWRPEWALLAVLVLAPWGAQLAQVPVRATEYLCFAFVTGWLLRVDRPLSLPGPAARLALVPATAYGLLTAVSWSRVAHGLSRHRGWARTIESARLLPADYLVTAGRDPHTAAALQIFLGIALCFAVATLVARDRGLAARTLVTLAVVGVAAAAATVVAVPVRYWITGDTNELIRYFVLTRSRYAFHVPDVNAAGSHFILAALIGLGTFGTARWRGVWRVASLAVVFAALWICGSRAAMAAGIGLVAFWILSPRLSATGFRWAAISPRTAGGIALVVLLVSMLSPLVVGSTSAMTGSASRSMSVREEFLVTSTRMLSTAPLLGVGVGTYYQRSNTFMPPGIKALYGRENAHDYFMQTAAELGVLGFVAFVTWLAFALAPLWRSLDQDGGRGTALALLLGCTGFLLTSVTGHPFLVVEVAVPFWTALGVAMSARPGELPKNQKVY